jgi:hypothetical protein
VPQLEMEHLAADVELERLAAGRVQQFRLGGGEAQRDEVGAGRARVDAIVDREVEPSQPEGEQGVSQSFPVPGEQGSPPDGAALVRSERSPVEVARSSG